MSHTENMILFKIKVENLKVYWRLICRIEYKKMNNTNNHKDKIILKKHIKWISEGLHIDKLKSLKLYRNIVWNLHKNMN